MLLINEETTLSDFANALNGKFTGITGTGVQFNHACDTHIKTPYVPETTAPVASLPPATPEVKPQEQGGNNNSN